MTFAGGCYCGAIRFEVDDLHDAGYCHCSICRRFAGAPLVAWANAPARNFRLTCGAPRGFASTAGWVRYFCPDCGSPVYQRVASPPDDDSDLLCILIPSLDAEHTVRPTAHIWCGSGWADLELGDDLPRFEAGELSAPAKRRPWRRE